MWTAPSRISKLSSCNYGNSNMARMQQNIALKFSFKKKRHRFSLDTKAEQLSTVLIEKDQIDMSTSMLRNQIFWYSVQDVESCCYT